MTSGESWTSYSSQTSSSTRCRIYAYSEDGLKPISISHEDSEDSWEESGMYYKEATASAAYHGDAKASISVTYGPLFGRGYSYDVVDDGDKYRLTNQQMTWIS